MSDKYYLLTFEEDWADEHDVPALACFTEEEFNKWKQSKQSVNAHLGNGGDNFCEDLQGLTGEELLKSSVSKLIVDESFYKTFHKAGLDGLSLCNIFENEYEGDENDEEEEE